MNAINEDVRSDYSIIVYNLLYDYIDISQIQHEFLLRNFKSDGYFKSSETEKHFRAKL